MDGKKVPNVFKKCKILEGLFIIIGINYANILKYLGFDIKNLEILLLFFVIRSYIWQLFYDF